LKTTSEEAARPNTKINDFDTWVDKGVDMAKASAKDTLSRYKDVNVIVRKMFAIIDQVEEEYLSILENFFRSRGREGLI
jgi:hypothetical protein